VRTVAHAHGGGVHAAPRGHGGAHRAATTRSGDETIHTNTARPTWKDSAAVGRPPYPGKRSRFSRSAFTATNRLEPDIESAAISGRSTSPNAGSKTPEAIGIATEL